MTRDGKAVVLAGPAGFVPPDSDLVPREAASRASGQAGFL